MNSTLDNFGISFPVLSSRTNLKLYNTSVTPRFIPKFKNVRERCPAKNYCPVSLLSSQITQRSVAFFLIFTIVLGLLYFLQIFSQLYMIEILGLVISLGLLMLQHLIYSRLLIHCRILVIVTNLSYMDFGITFQAFLSESFELFFMGIICKNIQSMPWSSSKLQFWS